MARTITIPCSRHDTNRNANKKDVPKVTPKNVMAFRVAVVSEMCSRLTKSQMTAERMPPKIATFLQNRVVVLLKGICMMIIDKYHKY